MTDLEAAAKAIHDLDHSMAGKPNARWEDQIDTYKEHGKARVRAVLEVLREGAAVTRCAVSRQCENFEVIRPFNAVLDEILRDRS